MSSKDVHHSERTIWPFEKHVRCLVIGSTGQLARDLIAVFGPNTRTLSHSEVDVRDGVAVSHLLSTYQPDWVINTAAFHQVDQCEINPSLAFEVNAIGAMNVS